MPVTEVTWDTQRAALLESLAMRARHLGPPLPPTFIGAEDDTLESVTAAETAWSDLLDFAPEAGPGVLRVNGREVDVLALFKAVHAAGGSYRVSAECRWISIGVRFGLPSEGTAGLAAGTALAAAHHAVLGQLEAGLYHALGAQDERVWVDRPFPEVERTAHPVDSPAHAAVCEHPRLCGVVRRLKAEASAKA